MRIWKERSFTPCIVAAATLENGVTIYIREDGTADGSDGRRYVHIARECGGDLETLGWTTESDAPLVLT